jgi:4'-phosphopantetheinyl transferase
VTHVVEVERTQSVLARWADPLATLTTVERARAGEFRSPADADDFVAAHLLVRECAAKLLDTGAEQIVIEQRCERCGGPHGRPVVAGEPIIRPAWSHSRGHVAAAAADRRVGVDIELRTASDVDDGLLARSATEDEARRVRADPDPVGAFLRLWVVKEALVKAGAITLDDFGSTALGCVADFALTTLDRSDQPDLAIGLVVEVKP